MLPYEILDTICEECHVHTSDLGVEYFVFKSSDFSITSEQDYGVLLAYKGEYAVTWCDTEEEAAHVLDVSSKATKDEIKEALEVQRKILETEEDDG